MARAKKLSPAAAFDPETHTPSGQLWAYGIRTWNADGSAHSDYKWDLEPGARNEASDWNPNAECGNGLHCNPYGVGDWLLLGDLSEVATGKRVLGIVRYDPDLAVDLAGKIKAPWMEVVLTTRSAGMGSILGFLAPKRHAYIISVAKKSEKALVTTGDRSAAVTTGDGSAAATTGKHSIAASLGRGGNAKAGSSGAIMLAAYGEWDGEGYPLLAVFAGMVGQTYDGVTIEPGVAYSLRADGRIEVAQ